MPRVELIYDPDCPNRREARKALLEAFEEAGVRPSWTEWDRQSAESPPHVRRYGSPTILVDGRDIAGGEPMDGSESCRIYDHGSGALRGVPPVSRIAAALSNSRPPASARRAEGGPHRWRIAASLPGVGAALLPIGACPACWPVYGGVLGSLGLGFLLQSSYLLPVSVALLGFALFALAFRAGSRRGYGPFALGIASITLILVFKFGYVLDAPVYAGLAGLVAASAWNGWPTGKKEARSCSKCAPVERAIAIENSP
ncbi:MAG: hypothetical protein Q8R92_04840 [Deltaproteobacteria bacterium]|nr:hypothetical protein [Deltaproteobacteria bacterium]